MLATNFVMSFVSDAENNDTIRPLAAASYQWLSSEKAIDNFVSTEVFANRKQDKKLPSSLHDNGHLKITAIDKTQKFKLIKDVYDAASLSKTQVLVLPTIDFDFVRNGNYLIPNVRTVQRNDHPYWEWQISPGVVWQQPEDNGFSRVVFPFSLQEKNANCTHNGLLILLINGKGKTNNGIFQIGSETCAYFQFDLAGRISVDYHKSSVENAKQLVAEFNRELSTKKIVHSRAQLIKDYPKLSLDSLLAKQLKGSTTSGLVINRQHYRLNCETRYGRYPYCDWLALPSYSTAKSIFAGIGLMRLQALVPNVEKVLVNKIIPECSTKQWQNVTLSDLLNMRTGNYLSNDPHKDESSNRMIGFFTSETHKQKLDKACNMFPHRAKPGKSFRYHTSDTYLAGVMLNRLFAKVSDQKDLYKTLLAGELWPMLKLSPLLGESKRTYDDELQPFTGWGLTYYASDIIKIVEFLQQQKSMNKRERLLDKKMLNSAMQNGQGNLNRDGGEANIAYNNGFWALEVGGDLGCNSPKWLPFMSGFGGITVALISPDLLYYNFADNQRFLWLDVIIELNQQFPLCEVL